MFSIGIVSCNGRFQTVPAIFCKRYFSSKGKSFCQKTFLSGFFLCKDRLLMKFGSLISIQYFFSCNKWYNLRSICVIMNAGHSDGTAARKRSLKYASTGSHIIMNAGHSDGAAAKKRSLKHESRRKKQKHFIVSFIL